MRLCPWGRGGQRRRIWPDPSDPATGSCVPSASPCLLDQILNLTVDLIKAFAGAVMGGAGELAALDLIHGLFCDACI